MRVQKYMNFYEITYICTRIVTLTIEDILYEFVIKRPAFLPCRV